MHPVALWPSLCCTHVSHSPYAAPHFLSRHFTRHLASSAVCSSKSRAPSPQISAAGVAPSWTCWYDADAMGSLPLHVVRAAPLLPSHAAATASAIARSPGHVALGAALGQTSVHVRLAVQICNVRRAAPMHQGLRFGCDSMVTQGNMQVLLVVEWTWAWLGRKSMPAACASAAQTRQGRAGQGLQGGCGESRCMHGRAQKNRRLVFRCVGVALLSLCSGAVVLRECCLVAQPAAAAGKALSAGAAARRGAARQQADAVQAHLQNRRGRRQ